MRSGPWTDVHALGLLLHRGAHRPGALRRRQAPAHRGRWFGAADAGALQRRRPWGSVLARALALPQRPLPRRPRVARSRWRRRRPRPTARGRRRATSRRGSARRRRWRAGAGARAAGGGRSPQVVLPDAPPATPKAARPWRSRWWRGGGRGRRRRSCSARAPRRPRVAGAAGGRGCRRARAGSDGGARGGSGGGRGAGCARGCAGCTCGRGAGAPVARATPPLARPARSRMIAHCLGCSQAATAVALLRTESARFRLTQSRGVGGEAFPVVRTDGEVPAGHEVPRRSLVEVRVICAGVPSTVRRRSEPGRSSRRRQLENGRARRAGCR